MQFDGLSRKALAGQYQTTHLVEARAKSWGVQQNPFVIISILVNDVVDVVGEVNAKIGIAGEWIYRAPHTDRVDVTGAPVGLSQGVFMGRGIHVNVFQR